MTAGTVTESAVFWTEQNEPVQLAGEMLREGGEGKIYPVDRPGLLAKLYRPDKNRYADAGDREEKLKKMIALQPGIDGLCWPTHLLYDQNRQFVGHLMPKAPDEAVSFRMSVLQLSKPSVQQSVLPGWNRRDLVRIAMAVADTADKLHENDILIGDINDDNFLADPGDSSKVYLVDCDSYQFGGYPCPVGTLDYTHPGTAKRLGISGELRFSEFLRTEQEENYTLAILLFRILTLGQYPFDYKDGGPVCAMQERRFPDANDEPEETRYIRKNMTDALDNAFKAAFRQLEKEPPTAREWSDLLDNYLYSIDHYAAFTKELSPITFRERNPNQQFYTAAECELDHRQFNMPKARYDRLKQKDGEPILCPACKEFLLHLKRSQALPRAEEPERCAACGEKTAYADGTHLYLRAKLKRQNVGDIYCAACTEPEDYTCAACGAAARKERWKRAADREKGNPPLCKKCVWKKEFSLTCCKCQKPFQLAVTEQSRWQELSKHYLPDEGFCCDACLPEEP